MIVSLVLLGPVVCVCKGTGIDLNENRGAEDEFATQSRDAK